MKKLISKIGFFPKTIGEIPRTYLESLTYEEQLLWFSKNLKQVIDNVDAQNTVIENAVKYMKDNIVSTTTDIINELVSKNEIYVETILSYDEDTEEIEIGGVIENE